MALLAIVFRGHVLKIICFKMRKALKSEGVLTEGKPQSQNKERLHDSLTKERVGDRPLVDPVYCQMPWSEKSKITGDCEKRGKRAAFLQARSCV